MITIFKAGIEDAATISELGVTTFYETYGAFNTDADMLLYTKEHYRVAKIIEEIMLPDQQYFLALLDNQPAGFAKIRNIKQPELLQETKNIEIERIYVLSQFQKLQIGKALIEHCIKTAKDHQFEMIWLGVWDQNPKAIHFYEKNGFERFGTHNFLLGNDLQTDWLMKKKL
jgi:ribosomal protein S18 acetylase RimI-like enzyme